MSPARKVSSCGKSAYRIHGTADGSRLAISRLNDTKDFGVIDSRSQQFVGPKMQFHVAHYHSLSPDGKYVAVTTWNGYHCRVFQTSTGKEVVTFDGLSSFCRFSPDGRWLVVGDGKQFQVIDSSNWHVQHRITRGLAGADAPIAFDQIGKVAAICHGFREIKLMETETWTELATFSVPPTKRIRELTLSPNGNRLAASHWDNTLTLWDLDLIRQGLQDLDLDWNSSQIEESDFEIPEIITVRQEPDSNEEN
jgi:WD40 repeat protein